MFQLFWDVTEHLRTAVGCFWSSVRHRAISSKYPLPSSGWQPAFLTAASETIHTLLLNCSNVTCHFLLSISYQAHFLSNPGLFLLFQ